MFNPDRFSLDKPVPTETTEDFNYLPFGGGRRKCIGAAPAVAGSLHSCTGMGVDGPLLDYTACL